MWAVFTVSGHSVNWDEVIAWHLDGPGYSFKEGGVFVPREDATTASSYYCGCSLQ